MDTRLDGQLNGLSGSPYAQELKPRFMRLRFAPAVEAVFAKHHLERSRSRIRAWHSMVLVMLLLLVLPVLATLRSGGDPGVFQGAWSSSNSGLLLALVLVNAVSRMLLVALAWTPLFERWYPRLALPLVSICHVCWAFMCTGEMLGEHPEYLAPLVTDVFAAHFFSGLLVRHALIVNVLAVAGLVAGGEYYAGALAPTMMYAVHYCTNVAMAAVAGFAYERSARGLFLEHSMLAEMAARDGLTSLKNRRAFDEHLARVWQQAVRDRRPIGILMIDVDRFKHYNDCYGHQAGDHALKRIAAVVNAFARRPLDLAARYGGEELALILYDLPREPVVEIAERLHNAVHALALEHDASPSGGVTVSIGVAIVRPRVDRSPQGAVQLADQALYEAKRAGRNCIKVMEREYDSLSTGAFRAAAAR